jgi:CheY-like chemotaxis protein
MKALIVSSDLVTQSKIASAAEAAGLSFLIVARAERLLETIEEHAIVVLDLTTPGYDVGELVRKLKSSTWPPRAILAFGPHVHETRLRSALDAGCDAVFTRGQFFNQATEILRPYSVT